MDSSKLDHLIKTKRFTKGLVYFHFFKIIFLISKIRQALSRRVANCIPPPSSMMQLFGNSHLNYQLMLHHTSTWPSHTTIGYCCGDFFDSQIIKPLIAMATNEEMLVSMFQEKVSIRFFNLANMLSYISQL